MDLKFMKKKVLNMIDTHEQKVVFMLIWLGNVCSFFYCK